MYKRTLSYYLNNGRWWFAFLFLGFLSSNIISAAPITVNAPNSTYFIANEGQWEGDFQFKCEVGSTVYYLTPKGMTVDFREFRKYPKPLDQRDPMAMFERDRERDSVTVRGHVVQIQYVDGSTRSISVGEGKLTHYSNYFLGRDSTKWRSRVGHYENIIVPEVWPGIDVEYRADQQGVETIYHVKPGADPTQIQMEYLGLDAPLRVVAQGNLVLATSLGDVKEKAPFAFQQEARMQMQVDAGFRVIDETRVKYEVGAFDVGKELVVDPLLYGTYLGGGDVDDGGPLTPAPNGGVYVAGATYAMSGFPTTPGAYDETGIFPGYREFVSLFNAEGELVASTLFGEIQTSENRNTEAGAMDLVFDSERNCLWMCGIAYPDWPLTPDAIDTTIRGLYDVDAFILRFNDDLTTLEYCSYIGGNHGDEANALALDSSGNLIVVGLTGSADFFVTADAFSTTLQVNDAFIWKYDPEAHEVIFSSFFGGERIDGAEGLSLSPNGHIWLNGQTNSARFPVTENAFKVEFSDTGDFDYSDAFFALLTLNPPIVEYCSYLGGESYDGLYATQEFDSFIYLVGNTFSWDFPISSGVIDSIGPTEPGDPREGFVARLNWETGDYIGTFIGGEEFEFIVCRGEWVGTDYVLIAGSTGSADFPVTGNAYDTTFNDDTGIHGDGFIAKFSLSLSELLYSSFIGGSHDDSYIGYVENSDSIWLSGTTLSIDLPVTPNAFQPGDNGLTSAFVQHFALDTTADTTSASDNVPIPFEFSVSAFPNPFNPTTTLSFILPKASKTELSITNILGQEVERVDLGRLNAGIHQQLIGRSEWASGLYFATLQTNVRTTTIKLLLIK